MPYKNFKKTEIIDEIGYELRKIRTDKSLTLSQVSEGLESRGTHLTNIMLGRIETGARRLDDDLFLALCDFYHTDPDQLVIRACQSHITELQETAVQSSSHVEHDAQKIADIYRKLPPNRQTDVRTMMRMFAYMDQFAKLEI